MDFTTLNEICDSLDISHYEDYATDQQSTNEWAMLFLNRTDYICNKVIEGVATWDDYANEKYWRGWARGLIKDED